MPSPRVSNPLRARMYLFIIGAVATNSTAQPASQPPGPVQSAADDALKVLTKQCAPCHKTGGSEEGRFGSITDFDNLLQRTGEAGSPPSAVPLLYPGKSSFSLVYLLASDGTMPMEDSLSSGEIETLRIWIDNMAAPINATPTGEAALAQTMLADVRSLAASNTGADVKDVRYVSLAPQTALARPSATLERYRNAVNDLLNSLSWKSSIAPPPVIVSPELLRIRLADYGWDATTWRLLIASYPYAVDASAAATQDVIPAYKELHSLIGESAPIVRADWLIATASSPPLYNALLLRGVQPALQMAIPGGLALLEAALNLAPTVARAGVKKSSVSTNNGPRVVEVRTIPTGGTYWRSYDFSSTKPPPNIAATPFSFQEDAGEIIFSLPNGMLGYALASADGKLLERAPRDIAIDRAMKSSGSDEIVNGLSCFSCHGEKGFIKATDSVRAQHKKASQADDDVRAVYIASADFDKQLAAAASRYQEALAISRGVQPPRKFQLGNTIGTHGQPIVSGARDYREPLSLRSIAAEVGMDASDIKDTLFKSDTPRAHCVSEALRTTFTEASMISRSEWECLFRDIRAISTPRLSLTTMPRSCPCEAL